MSTVAAAACLLMSADCWSEHLGRRLDQVRRSCVERGDLVEHELLVGQRLGHDDRRAQRATVVVVARSTPLISSTLLRRMRSSAR